MADLRVGWRLVATSPAPRLKLGDTRLKLGELVENLDIADDDRGISTGEPATSRS
jgi:hypothetical protein